MIDPIIIRARRDAGESVQTIADSLGVSPRRIYQVIGPERSRPRIDEARAAEIRSRFARGQSRRQIADELGIARASVNSIVGEDDRPAAERFTAEEEESILRQANAGHEPASIAKQIGRSTSGVRGVIERAKERDPLRDQIIERASALGWDANRIERECRGIVPAEHIGRYLRRESTMNSGKVAAIIGAMG
ncbi:MAG: hypothetical protein JO353_02190, partial [Phycisphaerae bacterium]|nr:hypothetical protein [Phycisphaerae bacterium]